MKPVDVKLSMYADFNEENSKEGQKFKAGDNVWISKHKTFFEKGNVPNSSEEVLRLKKLKILCYAQRRRNCWNVLPKRIAKNK